MFCKSCGKEIENGAKFCKSCGAPVEQTAAAAGSGAQANRLVGLGIRIVLIVVSLLMALSTVLPYVVFDSDIAKVSGIQSVTLLSGAVDQMGDGVIYIILAAAVILVVCLRKKIPVLVCCVVALIMRLYELRQIKTQLSEQYAATINGKKIDIWTLVQKGSGWHLLTVSAVLLAVFGILYFLVEKKGAEQ